MFLVIYSIIILSKYYRESNLYFLCLLEIPDIVLNVERIEPYKATLVLIQYSPEEDKDEKVLENQQVLKTPIVRNKSTAVIGYKPEIWKQWI